ncbi:MAG: hypothetical protein GY899_08405 [Verrucomicrobiaceae bacterium]|nr:hypothetical protein [Verrucomicrobiaceae bacterium]
MKIITAMPAHHLKCIPWAITGHFNAIIRLALLNFSVMGHFPQQDIFSSMPTKPSLDSKRSF